MSSQALNVRQIRDLLDYLEAEAMAGVHEQRSGTPLHQDFVNALKSFMQKYGVHLPVVVTREALTPAVERRMREGLERDWREHSLALQSIRPLIDLLLAVTEGRPHDEQVRLHRQAFPHAFGAD